MLDNALWYQVSHDHVNLFTVEDFARRFRVIDQGTFGNEEWGWVLVDVSTFRPAPALDCDLRDAFLGLFSTRESMLRQAARLGQPLAIWGAAGKGIVLSQALVAAGADVTSLIDADPMRWDLHVEPTGLSVLSPLRALDVLSAETLLLACNPNHFSDIHGWVNNRRKVWLPRDLEHGPP